MKIKNNNTYSIMFGMDFIKAGEVLDLDDKIAEALLKHPNVEEYVSKEQVEDLEAENKKLKEQLEKVEANKAKTTKTKASSKRK